MGEAVVFSFVRSNTCFTWLESPPQMIKSKERGMPTRSKTFAFQHVVEQKELKCI